jgi:predicted membrane channel-forming protein YqfA (hemolysin III family)
MFVDMAHPHDIFLFYSARAVMAVVSGILFGAALAVYIMSLYDRRVKKPYALAAAIVAAVASIGEFATSFIPASQTCVSTASGIAGTTTTVCTTNYANDPLAFTFFVLSLIMIVMLLFELTAEGIAAWP